MSGREEEDIEVFPLTEEGNETEPPAASAEPADRFRLVLTATAVVGALALCVTAWTTVQRLSVERRQACIIEAQSLTFRFPFPNADEAEDQARTLQSTLEDCGVDTGP